RTLETLFFNCLLDGEAYVGIRIETLNDQLLHLGNGASQQPLFGEVFTSTSSLEGVDNMKGTLAVKFNGTTYNWGLDNHTISGVEVYDPGGIYTDRVRIYFNGERKGLFIEDFPLDEEGCLSEGIWGNGYLEFTCPFTFTSDVSNLLIEGDNMFTIDSTGEDFVLGDVMLLLISK
ncbi:MAG: hypothetical protein RQ754_16630, partial [Desulfuromonadales bacterium]|nr:hypothetical protein [Desulfuromonadales bacterium]